MAMGLKLYALIGLLAMFALLSWLVVIMTRIPRSRNEWVVGLVTTLVGSIGGGSFVVQRLGLHEWANNWFGMVSIATIVFCCGLPFWAVVRWTFNYINKKDAAGSDIFEVAREIKDEVKR